jgi:Mg2+ transporter MgtE
VVDPIHSDISAVKLRISHRKLARMHPADIADVVERLSLQQRDAVFASLDDETAADALEELSPEDQADILERLDPERAADILEEMKPDEAADLLSDLPEHQQEALLDMMEAREADEVEELLAYGEDTAGGLMTTEYVGLSADLTAAQAIDKLRELEPNAESVYYVYVVDEQENLQGVLSLRDLIVAKPDTPIRDIMITNVIRVSPGAATEDVTDIMRKYNLLAVPVVDDDGHMEGIVTVDDALDTVLAAGGRRRARIFG